MVDKYEEWCGLRVPNEDLTFVHMLLRMGYAQRCQTAVLWDFLMQLLILSVFRVMWIYKGLEQRIIYCRLSTLVRIFLIFVSDLTMM